MEPSAGCVHLSFVVPLVLATFRIERTKLQRTKLQRKLRSKFLQPGSHRAVRLLFSLLKNVPVMTEKQKVSLVVTS
eukprot:COSAG02_NODE_29733_length_564_cov_0.769892_2_plen_75_part_01